MQIKRASEVVYDERGETFTGTVWVGPGLEIRGLGIHMVSFEPGARTYWHSHEYGQLLYVVSGRGRTQSQGGEVVQMASGDFVSVDAGEVHWHGAAPDAPLVHVAVNAGGGPDWGEAVTDAEYSG